jgi:hypothetical protein
MAVHMQGELDIHPEELEDSPLQEKEAIPGSFWKENKIDPEEAINALGHYLQTELHRSKASRFQQERVWEENLRMYEGIPKLRQRNTPYENASNLEIALGAMAADAIYAQMVNLIFNISPIVTVQATSTTGQYTEHAKAMQVFIERLVPKLDMRRAAENAILDDVKLGTGIIYTPWREKRKKTVVDQVIKRGPKQYAVPVEDFFVPGGAYDDLQNERWCAIRYWLTGHELTLRERDLGWDIEGIETTGNVDRTRQVRERLGRHDGANARNAGQDNDGGELYEIFDVYCYFDIDGDGIDEDLLVTFEQRSRKVLRLRWNPYERRPFEVCRYQLRQFMFYGLSVVEMARPYQEGATNLYNHWVDNSLLANCRFWTGPHGAVDGNQLRIWPNRYLPVSEPGSVQAVAMADTWPSAPAALQTTVSFAERRTGINELQNGGGSMGTRTPGITALSMLQQQNERFGPAFDAAKEMVAKSVKQALFRYQERLLADDFNAEQDIIALMGDQDAALIVEVLRSKDFDDAIAVELTSSSTNVNRETARQNWVMLIQTLISLYEKIIPLAQMIESPEVGPITKDASKQLITKVNEMIDRLVRTFDQVRDPGVLQLDLEQQIAQFEQQMAQQQMIAQVLQSVMAAGQGAQGGVSPMGGAVPGQPGMA